VQTGLVQAAAVESAECLAEVEVKVKLRPTVSRPVRLGVRHPSQTAGLLFCSALSDERTCLYFTIAAGPHQSSPTRV
jgi:hypothetical protein